MANRKWYRVVASDLARMLPFILLVPALVVVRWIGTIFGANDYTLGENIREAIGPQCAFMTMCALVYLAVNGLRLRDRLSAAGAPNGDSTDE